MYTPKVEFLRVEKLTRFRNIYAPCRGFSTASLERFFTGSLDAGWEALPRGWAVSSIINSIFGEEFHTHNKRVFFVHKDLESCR